MSDMAAAAVRWRVLVDDQSVLMSIKLRSVVGRAASESDSRQSGDIHPMAEDSRTPKVLTIFGCVAPARAAAERDGIRRATFNQPSATDATDQVASSPVARSPANGVFMKGGRPHCRVAVGRRGCSLKMTDVATMRP